MISRKSLLIIAVSALILTSIPAVFVMVKIYPTPFAVPVGPYGEGDYYYDRIQEIKDGYPLLGNPYFFEHRDEIAPAFFLADWVAAIPTIVGLPLIVATQVNFFIWSFLAILFLFFLFKKCGLPDKWALIGGAFSYLSIYLFMLRPVSMQIVFPFYFLFLLSFFVWWHNPSEKKYMFFLSFAAAFSSYLYSYTTQVIVVLFGLSAVYFLIRKDWEHLKSFAYSAIGFGLMIIPLIFFTLKQIAHPYYWETMVRIGLNDTHLPIALFFISGFFVLSGLFLLALIWFDKEKINSDQSNVIIFFLLGASILGVSGSNIITGKELENAQHLERYIIPWLSMIATVAFWLIYKKRLWLDSKKWVKLGLAFSVVIISFAAIRYFVIYGPTSVLSYSSKSVEEWKNVQNFVKPLSWLDKKEKEPIVVWADVNGEINNYVAMLSKHYILFQMGGILHLVSDREGEERFMVAHYFDLTEDVLKNDYKLYAGTGNAIHPWMTNNRRVKICLLLLLDRFGVDCGEIKDAVSWWGEEYFDSLFRDYNVLVKPHIDEYLNKYHVSYIIRDKTLGGSFFPEKIAGAKLVYNDERFMIYKYDFVSGGL